MVCSGGRWVPWVVAGVFMWTLWTSFGRSDFRLNMEVLGGRRGLRMDVVSSGGCWGPQVDAGVLGWTLGSSGGCWGPRVDSVVLVESSVRCNSSVRRRSLRLLNRHSLA